MMLIVIGLFVVCRGPWHVIRIVHDLHDKDNSSVNSPLDRLRRFAALLAIAYCWTTPVVYALFNGGLRRQIVVDAVALYRAVAFCCGRRQGPWIADSGDSE